MIVRVSWLNIFFLPDEDLTKMESQKVALFHRFVDLHEIKSFANTKHLKCRFELQSMKLLQQKQEVLFNAAVNHLIMQIKK